MWRSRQGRPGAAARARAHAHFPPHRSHRILVSSARDSARNQTLAAQCIQHCCTREVAQEAEIQAALSRPAGSAAARAWGGGTASAINVQEPPQGDLQEEDVQPTFGVRACESGSHTNADPQIKGRADRPRRPNAAQVLFELVFGPVPTELLSPSGTTRHTARLNIARQSVRARAMYPCAAWGKRRETLYHCFFDGAARPAPAQGAQVIQSGGGEQAARQTSWRAAAVPIGCPCKAGPDCWAPKLVGYISQQDTVVSRAVLRM